MVMTIMIQMFLDDDDDDDDDTDDDDGGYGIDNNDSYVYR